MGKSPLLALISHIHAQRKTQCPETEKCLTEPTGTQPTDMFPTLQKKNTRSQDMSAVLIDALQVSEKMRTDISRTKQ